MAASTITRVTWTDGSTVLTNARKNTDLYDKIDEMFAGAGSYATFSLGGKLDVEGFGDHLWDGSGTGANRLQIQNTTAGTANYAALELGQDADTDLARLEAYSGSWSGGTATQNANGVSLRGMGAGGLTLAAEDASGEVVIAAGGTATVVAADANYLYGSGAAPLYPATLTDVENTVTETTFITATIAKALSDGDMLLVTSVIEWEYDTNTSLTLDVAYGGVEAQLFTEATFQQAAAAVSSMQIAFIRNGTDVWAGLVGHTPQTVDTALTAAGVQLVSPTTTAGQTLNIRVTLGSAAATHACRPKAATVMHLFA